MSENNEVEQHTDGAITIAVRKRTPEASIVSDVEKMATVENGEQKKEELSPGRGVTIQPLTHTVTTVATPMTTEVEPPEKKPDSEESPGTSSEVKKPIKDAKQSEADSVLVVAELVNTKKYFLPIKEKRASSLFRLEQSAKGVKAQQPKKKKSETQAKIPKVIKKRSAGSTVGVILAGFAVVVMGMYLSVDAGLINIGWRPPYSVFGNNTQDQPEMPIIAPKPIQ